jgi:hypothetical protein
MGRFLLSLLLVTAMAAGYAFPLAGDDCAGEKCCGCSGPAVAGSMRCCAGRSAEDPAPAPPVEAPAPHPVVFHQASTAPLPGPDRIAALPGSDAPVACVPPLLLKSSLLC